MPSLAVNIAGTILGLGTLTTVIVVPTVLAGRGGQNNKQNESRGADGHSGSTHHDQVTQTPKSRSQWGEQEFKDNCFGGFLKEDSKGEMIVCFENKEQIGSSVPLFYLHWKDGGNNNFGEIKEISVNGHDSFNWKFGFGVEIERRRETRTLSVLKSEHPKISILQFGPSQPLHGRCKDFSKTDGGVDYQMKCIYWTEEHTYVIKKDWFN